jgi:CIC family chloride channel protein
VHRVPAVARAAVIGAVVGLVMAFRPQAVGGGDHLTQALLDGRQFTLTVLVGYLLSRLILGPLSYSAPVVGGLFAPMLAIGALWGVLFADVVDLLSPWSVRGLAVPMAVVGMSCFFSACVRAPVTGMVLVIEMTASTAVIVPLLAATAAAVLAAYLVGSPPIYDSLRERSLSKF